MVQIARYADRVKELAPRTAGAKVSESGGGGDEVDDDEEDDAPEDLAPGDGEDEDGDAVGALPGGGADPLNNSLAKKDLRRLHQRFEHDAA